MKFKFWKNNRTDQEFELSESELKRRFKEWLLTKDMDWLDYYYGDQAIVNFVSLDVEGLQSVYNGGDWEKIYSALYPLLKEHMEPYFAKM